MTSRRDLVADFCKPTGSVAELMGDMRRYRAVKKVARELQIPTTQLVPPWLFIAVVWHIDIAQALSEPLRLRERMATLKDAIKGAPE